MVLEIHCQRGRSIVDRRVLERWRRGLGWVRLLRVELIRSGGKLEGELVGRMGLGLGSQIRIVCWSRLVSVHELRRWGEGGKARGTEREVDWLAERAGVVRRHPIIHQT